MSSELTRIEHRIDAAHDGAALGAIVREATHGAWTAAKKLIANGKVTLDGATVTDPGTRVRTGQSVVVNPSARRVDAGDTALARDAIVFLDAHIVVVEKPAGVSTVPYEEGERGTLVDKVRFALHRAGKADANAQLFVVHRIDKDTSGLVVFARSWTAKRHLAALFRTHSIERRYLALINGVFRGERATFDTHLVENRGDGLRGSAKQSGLGIQAVTHVAVVARAPRAEVTLLSCQLETGRTHQIRIHLAEAGHPLVGERVYSRHYEGPNFEAPRMMLHAAVLGFTHPAEHERVVRLMSPLPADFVDTAGRAGIDASLDLETLFGASPQPPLQPPPSLSSPREVVPPSGGRVRRSSR